ncbi:tungsten-containing formylmethanofuran dehydrogenase subunit B [Allomesorhizobium alhagi]|jgi:formylmethanofuran dehydrogenase subunit B|uniref:Tungsten-containing formylmethanofuran dehydrogenase subunit B n=1 Tax=Mesorhizobium alhagi CCNWXJ12-2 TaxID=1107882 RepID=H0HRA1_9HYPH|nr:tungsten-containing formylmethanofuran dehydrogenase subunit B [Mesorhizobium alhagi]EHK56730.1 tungsten-containing formylmethanofuran dehydrogenase subunit B [Mesorhizobium alhagi CCNWXJ12-2]
MAVAWIGNRETLVEHACEQAAMLLQSSRCPVISFDTDIHGTRAAIALAERVGAAYDHVEGAGLSRETALFTDKGAMIVAPGEVRRRADVVAIVGELPAVHHSFVAELADTVPDLSATNAREFFLIGDEGTKVSTFLGSRKATPLSSDGGLSGTLAALRAQRAGRRVSKQVSNFDDFARALGTAKFPVFLFSGHGADGLALEMLQGLIADINRKSRASALHLPASESGWGSVLASTWMTGFAPRTGFARGFPEYDPWRFDVERALASGEADLHLWISAGSAPPAEDNGVKLIALAKTAEPVAGAEITIAIGEVGVDHEAVVYSGRTGTLAAIKAQGASELPSAAAVIRLVADKIPAEAALPC